MLNELMAKFNSIQFDLIRFDVNLTEAVLRGRHMYWSKVRYFDEKEELYLVAANI